MRIDKIPLSELKQLNAWAKTIRRRGVTRNDILRFVKKRRLSLTLKADEKLMKDVRTFLFPGTLDLVNNLVITPDGRRSRIENNLRG